MKFWFDTEFIDDGHTIDLISIGIVAENGAVFYAESLQCDLSLASEWVRKHVFPSLSGYKMTRRAIADSIRDFVGAEPEFWAWYADYDWVALCQLYGTMMDLPEGWPMFCRDVRQLADAVGNPSMQRPAGDDHNALADAEWAKHLWFEFSRMQKGKAAA